jgi:hypothetical protein
MFWLIFFGIPLLLLLGDVIKMIPASQAKGLGAMFEKLPEVLEKAVEMKYGQKEEAAGEKKAE